MLTTRHNIHHSKLPKPGELVNVYGLSRQGFNPRDRWLVFVPGEYEEVRQTFDERPGHGFSDSFVAIIERASRAGCVAVNFDQDAAIVDGLPVFDW